MGFAITATECMAKAVVHGLTRCRSPWWERWLWWQEHGTRTPHLRSLRNQAQALAHRYRQSPTSPARPPKDSTASQNPYRLGSSIQTQEASPGQGAADLNPSVDVESGVKGPGLSYLFPLHSSTHICTQKGRASAFPSILTPNWAVTIS